MTRRRGRRCRELLDDLKEKKGYSHLKEEVLDRSVWKRHWICHETGCYMNETESHS
jgi:hypothetical protein